jgi:hypothetical protein
VEDHHPIGPLDPEAPPSRRVTAGQGAGSGLVNMVPTWPEALDHALEALGGFGRPERIAIGDVDSESPGLCRARFVVPNVITAMIAISASSAELPRDAEMEFMPESLELMNPVALACIATNRG